MAKGLTATIVFDGMSLNYGEGVGNISELKKISRGGEFYSYLSRQAIRYDIYRMLKEAFSMDADKENPLTEAQKVIQFKPDVNVRDYMEADLFGYMKTEKAKGSLTRPATVRITPAISLEPMYSDIEFGTNKNFADRVKSDPNPFMFEHHYSLYSYTITIDLDRVGRDDNDGIELEPEVKAERVKKVLEVLKVLNRDIKGRTESLNPLFAIGGVYNIKNPFFLNRVKVFYNKEKRSYYLNTEILKSILELSFNNNEIRKDTIIGYVKGFWLNEEEFNSLCNIVFSNIGNFFDELSNKVEGYYLNNQSGGIK